MSLLGLRQTYRISVKVATLGQQFGKQSPTQNQLRVLMARIEYSECMMWLKGQLSSLETRLIRKQHNKLERDRVTCTLSMIGFLQYYFYWWQTGESRNMGRLRVFDIVFTPNDFDLFKSGEWIDGYLRLVLSKPKEDIRGKC